VFGGIEPLILCNAAINKQIRHLYIPRSILKWRTIRFYGELLNMNGVLKHPIFPFLVGQSEPIQRIIWLIKKVAPSPATVLIEGESGTGKELVARYIHYYGPRKNNPFVAVNCSALSDNLLESELFGHEKGAFTGAIDKKAGRFERAHGGTLFLDEIGELSQSFQVKLLRILQELEFERVGGTKTIKVNVRILAATNKNLEREVEKSRFRKDLFFRLNVIKINVPPLKDRKEDIPLLIDYFMDKYTHQNRKNITSISYKTIEALKAYPFPGNIRELENIMERAIVLSNKDNITVDDLPKTILKRSKPEVKFETPCNIDRNKLLNALKNIVITTDSGVNKKWYKSLRSTNIELICHTLLTTNFDTFSRSEFILYMNHNTKRNRISYKTAGQYLNILKKNQICDHNRKKANKSKYRLSETFVQNV
jgi:transcriptional regulator with PAS, ATPase and Fis domain